MESVEQKIHEIKEEEKEEEEKSILDTLIDLLPFEMHVPGYRFCGPGTNLSKRVKQRDVGINPLDEACRQHDIAYNDKNTNRREADRRLAEQAFARMLGGETPPDERTVAMMTACCMVSKITFEKFFNRIKKAIKNNDKKKKNKIVDRSKTKKPSKSTDGTSKKKKKLKSVEVKNDKKKNE